MIWIRGDCYRGWCGWSCLHPPDPPVVHSSLPIYHSQFLLISTNVWQTSAELKKPSPFFPKQLPFLPAGCLGPSVLHILYLAHASHSRVMRSCGDRGWAGLKATCPASLGTLGLCPASRGDTGAVLEAATCSLCLPVLMASTSLTCLFLSELPCCCGAVSLPALGMLCWCFWWHLWLGMFFHSTNWDWHMQHVDI